VGHAFPSRPECDLGNLMTRIDLPTIAPMSYKALLFCPEQKTYRTVTQILGELDFEIETCNEPFAAVKKLTAEHFDAIVVDCENEQNATLLFKSSRHSSANRASLSIAVVEGQAGVAKAFRIGANLVLTKPLNVEQSKGTIRVARGLLRKSDSPKSANGVVGASTFASVESAIATAEPESTARREIPAHAFSLSSPGFSESVFELEKEPEVKPEPTEAALLESMQDPGSEMMRARTAAHQAAMSKLQPISPTVGTAPDFPGSAATGHTLSGLGAGAASSPHAPLEENKHGGASDLSPSESSGAAGSRRPLLIAAVFLLLAVGAFYLWQKSHSQPAPDAAAPTVNQPQAAPVQAPPPPTAEPSSTTTPAQPSGDSTPARRPAGSDKTPAKGSGKTKKTAFLARPIELGKRLA
jgi:DNA-binding response OmpR family regulator